MSESLLSTLSIEIEARQAKLDRDLDQAERKAKQTGEKMEGSLSLGGVADKMVKVFAALGTIEAGFKGLTSLTQMFSGDMESALDTLESLPFGMGPVIAAGRDFFEVISGSRAETERLAAEWAKVASEINNAQANVEKLIESQQEEELSPLQKSNRDINEINELLRRYTDFRNEIKDFPELEPLPEDIATRLAEIGIEAKTAGEAFEILGKKRDEAFEAGQKKALEDRADALQRIADIERQTRIERLQAQGTTLDSDIEARRIQAEADRDRQLAEAREDMEKAAIEEQFALRMRLLDEEIMRRRAGEEEAALQRERKEYQAQQRRIQAAEREIQRAAEKQRKEAEQAERERFVEGKGIAAEEFLRTSFEGGTTKVQEVKDMGVLDALGLVNGTLKSVEAWLKRQAATLQ